MDDTATGAASPSLLAWLRQGFWFVVVGVLFTAANATLYLLLRQWCGLVIANVIALALSTVASSEANRFFASALGGIGRFLLLRLWVFGQR